MELYKPFFFSSQMSSSNDYHPYLSQMGWLRKGSTTEQISSSLSCNLTVEMNGIHKGPKSTGFSFQEFGQSSRSSRDPNFHIQNSSTSLGMFWADPYGRFPWFSKVSMVDAISGNLRHETFKFLCWPVVWNVFFSPYIWNNHPNWLIFFRGVETTNQIAIGFWRVPNPAPALKPPPTRRRSSPRSSQRIRASLVLGQSTLDWKVPSFLRSPMCFLNVYIYICICMYICMYT